MSQRDLFYKWLLYCLMALGWMALQQLVLNRCTWWGGVHPFVWPMVPVMIALLEKRSESCTFALLGGLLCDLLAPGVIPGFYLLTFLICALLAGLIASRVILPGFLCAFVCSVVAFLVSNLLLMLFLSSSVKFSGTEAFSLMGKELLLSLLLFAPVYLSFRLIRRRIHND